MSPVRADEVEVEVEQSDLRRAALQGPRQAEQQVIRQVGVPQNQLLYLIGCSQYLHHGVELQVLKQEGFKSFDLACLGAKHKQRKTRKQGSGIGNHIIRSRVIEFTL